MSPVFRRILLHGSLAAGVLALVGAMMANLAGTWVASQPTPRLAPEAGGLPANIVSENIGEQLRWRLPLAMAAWGVVVVAIGECLLAAFRKPTKPAVPGALTPDQQAEAIIQQILDEQEAARAGVKAESPSRASGPPVPHSAPSAEF